MYNFKFNSKNIISSKSMIFMFTSTAIISIISNSWMEIWILMEINMISFSLYLSKKNKFEISMKYFSMQMMASCMIISSFLMKEKEIFKNKLLMVAILLKTGMFPFFSWSVKMSEKIEWKKLFYFLSVQKLIAVSILMKFKNNSMETIMIMNILIICLSFKMWKSSKKMILISSTNNFTWILLMNFSVKSIMMFFFLYNLSNMYLISKMNKENNKNMNFSKKKYSKILEMMVISGMPPFIMFFIKWKMSEELMNYNSILTINFLFMSSSLMMIMYMKTNFKNMFKEKSKMKKSSKFKFINMIMLWKLTN